MAGGGCSSLEAETPENPSFLFPSVLLDQKQATECTPGINFRTINYVICLYDNSYSK